MRSHASNAPQPQNINSHISYADVTKTSNIQTYPSNNQNLSESSEVLKEMREMMSFMKQIMQQMTAMTNLLINLMPKPANPAQ